MIGDSFPVGRCRLETPTVADRPPACRITMMVNRLRFPGIVWFATAVLLWLFGAQPACADDAAGREFFEKKIRPVLVQHCYKCHSASAKAPKGGLRVDSRAGLHKGGESGP